VTIYHQTILKIYNSGDSEDECFLALVGDVFQSALLGLGYEQRRQDTGEHEQGENLEDVVDELVTFRSTAMTTLGDDALTWLLPPLSLRRKKPTCAAMAPILPLAAEIP
jgi:hypothetical protein